jgi:hypothetical protein
VNGSAEVFFYFLCIGFIPFQIAHLVAASQKTQFCGNKKWVFHGKERKTHKTNTGSSPKAHAAQYEIALAKYDMLYVTI